MLNIRQKYGIENLVYSGDFFDELTFSDFETSPEDIVDFDQEIEAAQKIVRILKSEFKHLYFTMGNHDVRFWRKMIRAGKAKNTTWKVIWNLVDKDLEISKYRYCEINDYWRVTHPKFAMKLGGFPIIRLRAKFDKSLVISHGHWWGLLQDPSARFYLIAPGCLCDPKKIAYVSSWDTSYDIWKPGFLMVMERTKPILFEENSPWGLYLK